MVGHEDAAARTLLQASNESIPLNIVISMNPLFHLPFWPLTHLIVLQRRRREVADGSLATLPASRLVSTTNVLGQQRAGRPRRVIDLGLADRPMGAR